MTPVFPTPKTLWKRLERRLLRYMLRLMIGKLEPVVECAVCGSRDVQIAMWVNPNTNDVQDDFGSWGHEDKRYCFECQGNSKLLFIGNRVDGQ